MTRLHHHLVAATVLLGAACITHAQDKKWWPLDVLDGSAQGKVVSYSPLDKASKPWMCAPTEL